jgi:hypothetical protein
MTSSKGIPILLNEGYLKFGVASSISWLPDQAPHCLIVGASGTGKSYLFKSVAGKCVLHFEDSQLFVADFKGDSEFSFLNDSGGRFARFYDCVSLLEQFYNRLLSRQSGEDQTRNRLFFFLDEYAVMCNSLEKKTAEEVKRQVGVLLMLGRSFRMQLCIAVQRADMEYFSKGARDNFGICIGLGNMGSESQTMLFHEFKNQIQPDRKRGTGYMTTNGTNFQAVQVMTINSMAKLHDTIKQGVTR